jgi:hypothetical protein
VRNLSLLLLLLPIACNGASSDPLWCEATDELVLPCATSDCVLGIAVDYVRVEPRGWIARELTPMKTALTAAEAEVLAVKHVKALGADEPTLVDSDEAGDFFICFLAYDPNVTKDSWQVIIHAKSGEVVFAGQEVWADPDRGYDPPLPAGWHGAAALGCTDGAAEPEDKDFRTTGSPLGSVPASTPAEAWEVAKRLNVVEWLTAATPYRVMVVSYSTDTGEFDPRSADWLVWITRD